MENTFSIFGSDKTSLMVFIVGLLFIVTFVACVFGPFFFKAEKSIVGKIERKEIITEHTKTSTILIDGEEVVCSNYHQETYIIHFQRGGTPRAVEVGPDIYAAARLGKEIEVEFDLPPSEHRLVYVKFIE